jgi:hypothetical protein
VESEFSSWQRQEIFLLCTACSTAPLVGRSRDRFPVVSLGIFSVAADRTMCPGVTQPLKMSTRDFSGKRRPVTHPRSAERQENPGP